jgi:hypothetical protein
MELRVGGGGNTGLQYHHHRSVEVVLHVRRADIQWCNQYSTEICETLETSIIPRMFTTEIQNHSSSGGGNGTSQRRIPELGLGGIPISGTSDEQYASRPPLKKKHKKSNQTKKWTKKELAARKKQLEVTEREQRKLHKDVFYAFSEHLDMIYRLEPVSNGATLVLIPNQTNNDNYQNQNNPSPQHCCYWQELEKLSKRIVLWCYPTGTIFSNETEELLDEGFLRPEMLPVASLFRAPKQQQQQAHMEQQHSLLGKDVIDVDENDS